MVATAHRRWVLLCFLCLAIWINSIDATIANVALPTIGQAMHATNADLQWVLDGFNVAAAGFVLLGSGLADRYGRKRILLIGLTIFTVASAAASLSQQPGGLIASRVVMGIGVALVIPPSLSIVMVEFTDNARKTAVAVWAGIAGLGVILGPVLGGILLSQFSWRSVFIVNIPAAIVAFIGILVLARESRAPGAEQLDYLGGLLSIVGLSGIVFAAIEGPVRGWDSIEVIAAGLVGALSICAFILWELRTAHPMFEIRVLRVSGVRIGGLCLALVNFTAFAILYLLPQYLQYVLHMSILQVGLALLPLGAVFAVATQLTPRLYTRLGVQRILVGGLVLMAIGLALLACMSTNTTYLLTLVAMVVFALGWAAVNSPGTVVIMDSTPDALAGSASSVNQVARQVGGALGVAIIGSIFASFYQSGIASIHSVNGPLLQGAQRSLGEALTEALTLPVAQGAALVHAATESFVRAAQIGFGVAAAITLLVALFAVFGLRKSPK